MKSLVLFLPALHRGYLDVIEEYDRVYLLDESVLKKLSRFTYLERDLRQFDVRVAKQIIESLWPTKEVYVADEKVLSEITDTVFLPEDEISEEVATTFLKHVRPTFVSVFLRWNKKLTTKESEPHANRTISKDELDREFMLKASSLSSKSSDWWRQIGAVIVKDGIVVSESYNRRLPSEYTQDVYGDPRSNFDAGEGIEFASTIHAESFAIAQAAKEGKALNGASIYVTTYPCPVCAKSIVMSGIEKVYYRDGYSLFDAERIFKAFNVEVIQVEDN